MRDQRRERRRRPVQLAVADALGAKGRRRAPALRLKLVRLASPRRRARACANSVVQPCSSSWRNQPWSPGSPRRNRDEQAAVLAAARGPARGAPPVARPASLSAAEPVHACCPRRRARASTRAGPVEGRDRGTGSARTSASTVSMPSTSRVSEVGARRARRPSAAARRGTPARRTRIRPRARALCVRRRESTHGISTTRSSVAGGAWSQRIALAARPGAEPESNRVVELAHAHPTPRSPRARGSESRARASPPRASRRARSRASSSGRSAAKDLPERRLHELLVGPSRARPARRRGEASITRTRRSPGRTSARGVPQRRTDEAAGTVRTSGRRDPRAGPP